MRGSSENGRIAMRDARHTRHRTTTGTLCTRSVDGEITMRDAQGRASEDARCTRGRQWNRDARRTTSASTSLTDPTISDKPHPSTPRHHARTFFYQSTGTIARTPARAAAGTLEGVLTGTTAESLAKTSTRTIAGALEGAITRAHERALEGTLARAYTGTTTETLARALAGTIAEAPSRELYMEPLRRELRRAVRLALRHRRWPGRARRFLRRRDA